MTHPFFTRARRVGAFIPDISAHSETCLFSPSIEIMKLVRLFLACWEGVAHRQFSGLYPLELSIRSKLMPSGRFPISLKKFMNVCQGAQTKIPLPPYSGQSGVSRLLHRLRMRFQVAYSGVAVRPCVVALAEDTIFLRHPHERVSPLLMCCQYGLVTVPQSQRQTHIVFQSTHSTEVTVNKPKR